MACSASWRLVRVRLTGLWAVVSTSGKVTGGSSFRGRDEPCGVRGRLRSESGGGARCCGHRFLAPRWPCRQTAGDCGRRLRPGCMQVPADHDEPEDRRAATSARASGRPAGGTASPRGTRPTGRTSASAGPGRSAAGSAIARSAAAADRDRDRVRRRGPQRVAQARHAERGRPVPEQERDDGIAGGEDQQLASRQRQTGRAARARAGRARPARSRRRRRTRGTRRPAS